METRERFGCGFDKNLIGRGTARLASTNEVIPTCPQYLSSTNFVISVLNYLDDYKSNRLGLIWDIPNALYQYLQIACSELSTWEASQNERVAQ